MRHIQIYNSLNKSIEALRLRDPNKLNWYICGPTLYDHCHLGHGRTFVYFDVIRRIIKRYSNNYKLRIDTTINFTDIDDKIIQKSKDLSVPWSELTVAYEKSFITDLIDLNINLPTRFIRVTDSIPIIIESIEKLLKDQIAYKTESGDVYFNIKKYSSTLSSYWTFIQERSASLPVADFALWKITNNSQIGWKAPWTVALGRPGWHIECSSMALNIYGNNLDLHSGGIDLKFPHHQNEIAQCRALLGGQSWCSQWIHTGSVLVGTEEKMSKSNSSSLIYIKDFLKNNSCDLFRVLTLMSHYQNDIEMITKERISNAEHILESLRKLLHLEPIFNNTTASLNKNSLEIGGIFNEIEDKLVNNFNTPFAVTELVKLSKRIPSFTLSDLSELKERSSDLIHGVFGITTGNAHKNQDSSILDDFISYRNQIRNILKNDRYGEQELRKNLWRSSDEARTDINEKYNVVINDDS